MPCCQPSPDRVPDPNACFARFWMVLNDNAPKFSVQGLPTFRHATQEEAIKEAARLAGCNPGIKFYVLETVAACVKSDVQWLNAVGIRDMPPF